MSAFFLLRTLGDSTDDSRALVEDYVEGLEMNDWKTGFGHATAKEWPDDATIRLRKTSGRTLADVVSTITNNLIVSRRLRGLIEQHCADIKIEYLPVRIVDHRARLLSDEYVIVNPIGTVDCLDTKASDILWDKEDPKKAVLVTTIVLSARKTKKAPALFRIREKPASYVFNRDLALQIHGAKFTNVLWTKLEPQ